jgi:hypothetical protein
MALNRQLFCKIVSPLSLILFLVGCDPDEAKFEAKARSVIVDPQKLQDWALPIIKEHNVGYEIPYTNWPAFLLVSNGPSSAWVAGWTTIKTNAVIVAWGGGFGHRVVIVGDKNFVITTNEMGRPVIQWIPGVYIVPKTEN